MPADTMSYTAVFKDHYGPRIQTQLSNRTPMLKKCKTLDAKKWGGGQVIYPIKVGRNTGHLATGEGGPFPAAGSQKYDQFSIPMRTLVGTCQWTEEVLERSEGDENSWVSAFESEMSGLVEDLSNDKNRMVWGYGRGVLATITTGASSTSQTVRDPLGVSGTANGSRYLNVDDVIAVLNIGPPSTIIRTGSTTISTVPVAGTSITVTPTINTTTGDIIVRAGATALGTGALDQTAVDKEPMGMLGLVDDGTYAPTISGLSRTTRTILRSTVISQVGTLSADVVQRGLDVADQLGDASIREFYGHHSVRRAFATITEQDRRYTGAALDNPDAGTKAARMKEITFGELPIHVDRHAPYGMLFAIDWRHIFRFVLTEGHWDQKNGNILKQGINASGVYTDNLLAFWKERWNLHCQRSNSCVRYDGISTTTVNVHIW